MIYLIDNYDSFTYNLVQRFGEIDSSLEIQVARNDQTSLEEIRRLKPERIVVSPGPCTPNEAGISKEVIREFSPTVPILGVCLGHQCMAEVFDKPVVRAPRLMHGKVSLIHHDGKGVFRGLPNPFTATRYHSLCVPPESVGNDLIVSAWTDDPGVAREVMGLRHPKYELHGVQFHPESFLTDGGIDLLKNFLTIAPAKWA